MMKVARAMLACRDPKKAGVTDGALWTVFDALCKAAVGNSKYLRLSENGSWGTVSQDVFNAFQDFIAEWDAAYAAQQVS
jgi:predicted ATPase